MKTIKNLKADEIRKSILQLAIQGKLVKQDPNDEPASELVKRIYAEKQKLIKEGKIKKDKNESFIFKGDDNCYYEKIGNSKPVKLEELPFDIPNSWSWVRLNSVSSIMAGGTPDRGTPKYWNGTIPWLKISDITSANKYVSKASEYITEEGMNNSSAKIMPRGTILYTIFATIGEVGILDFESTCNQAIAGINTYLKSIDDYLYFILINLQDYMKSISKGCAQFNINQKILKETLIALPPLNEQIRIVKKINSCEPLLKDYETAETKLSLLESEFPEQLKKSILQYAIEGKLVKQDPNDEPASVLLERIKVEKEKLIKEGKIKKDKNESYIYQGDDKNYYEKVGSVVTKFDVPYEIPNLWSWVKCKMILRNIQYGFNGAGLDNGNAKLLRITDIQNNDVNWSTLPYCNIDNKLLKDYQIKKDDIFIARTGGTIGKSFRLIEEKDNTVFAGYLIRFQLINHFQSEYIQKFLNSPLYWSQVADKSAGTGQPNINGVSLSNLIIPIPPIAEQERLIRKINYLFEII